MIEFDDVQDLVSPVVIAAFEGWNDAADAASGLVDHLIEQWKAEVIGAIDPEEFYDFQVNRPIIGTDVNGYRRLTWPTTRIAVARPAELDRDVILVRGIEPNMKWRQFCAELLAACDDLGAELVVTMGALLADTPHTRPIPVSGTATEPELVDRLVLEQSTYEGPTGIVGVFNDACTQLDIPAVSYWAAVPHYVAQPPCPKATLALLGQLEELLQAADAHRRPRRRRQGLGARRGRARRRGRGRRRLRPCARGDPRHRRAPGGLRRGHRPRVRALPQAPRHRLRFPPACLGVCSGGG